MRKVCNKRNKFKKKERSINKFYKKDRKEDNYRKINIKRLK